ncbi:MAG: hypothetical protein ABIH85_02150 [Candidatus Omnitrophota bacterium]
MAIGILNNTYRYIFLVQNRDFWRALPFSYDKEKDLVLTFDFGLKQEILGQGGKVDFIDHLVDDDQMEGYNFEAYKFFDRWHYDKDGNDIFMYKGIEVGNIFRIEIWNEITYYPRMFLNVHEILKIKCKEILVGVNDKYLLDILNLLKVKAGYWTIDKKNICKNYYFPIFQWVNEGMYSFKRNSGKRKIKNFLWYCLDKILNLLDKFSIFAKNKKYVFALEYYPTRSLIKRLIRENKVRIAVVDYCLDENLFVQRRLPPTNNFSFRDRQKSEKLIKKFLAEKHEKWILKNIDISERLYTIIIRRIRDSFPRYIKILDTIVKFFDKKALSLMITVSNIGIVNCLVANYCKKNDIPVYLIVNGFLGKAYLSEAKEATWINSYGRSMKENYFRDMKNVVCLGDPRMDSYMESSAKKSINTETPTIVIGAGGFSNIDLNSYVAFEFDFLNDIMAACRKLRENGRKMDIIIKVRTNGYMEQYLNFVKEYYNDFHIQLYDKVSMKEVLEKADFYISIYSQTLFEASCLGIPVLFYKKDTEKSYPPFDGKSELVTAFSFEDLLEKMELFYKSDSIFDGFKKKEKMEKYIGLLDGHNLERNKEFIYSKIAQ